MVTNDPTSGSRPLRSGLAVLALVTLVSVAGQAAPARADNACRKSCAIVAQTCQIPFRLAFQTQRRGCTGIGKKLCITAAKLLFSAGRQLCRSTAVSCRKCCQRGATLCSSTCGDGIVTASEDCDPPGWASCREGAACGTDCQCPATSATRPAP